MIPTLLSVQYFLLPRQWEEIWKKNKAKLIRRLSERNTATNVELLGGHVRSKGEDVAQELKDFIKGLDSIKTIGL